MLTLEEIKNVTFHKARNGYQTEDVDDFIDSVIETVAGVIRSVEDYGATYIILYVPAFALSVARASCLGVSELFRYAPLMPISISERTWSCISEMSGETTIVIPSSARAGT